MLSDIVERLRGGVYGIDRIPLCKEAADEIERLRALAEHLRHCRDCGETDVSDCPDGSALWAASMPDSDTQSTGTSS